MVSDEIYALSVYDQADEAGQGEDGEGGKGERVEEGFTSVLSIREQELGEGYDKARLHGELFFSLLLFLLGWTNELTS